SPQDPMSLPKRLLGLSALDVGLDGAATVSLAAQHPVTRAAAIEAALARGARAAFGRADTAAAAGLLRGARAYPNPSFAATYTKDVPRYHYIADVSLDLPWLRSARIGAAAAARDATGFGFAFERAAIGFAVDTTYTHALATAAHARLSRRNARDADSLLTMARLRREVGDPADPAQGVLPTVGLALVLPLFNRNGGEIGQARAARDRAQANLDVTRRESAADVARARRSFSAARARLERDRRLLASADRVAAMSLQAYAEGAVPLANVLEAQRNAREALGRYIDDVAAANDAAAQSAATALETAQHNFARAARLVQAGILPQKDSDQAASELAQAQVAAVTARRSQQLATLRAPLSGVVTRMSAVLGASVDPTQPLVEIADPGALDVVFSVSPAEAADMRDGDSVSLSAGETARGDPLGTGVVTGVAAAVDSLSRAVAVRV